MPARHALCYNGRTSHQAFNYPSTRPLGLVKGTHMASIEHSITIQRPLFDVFRMVIDFETIQSWQPDMLSVSITSGDPLRPGSMISMVRRFMGRPISVNVDVLDFQRNKIIELTGVHGNFPYRRVMEFASASRETIIRDKIIVRAPWFYFWYTPFLMRAMTNQTKGEWNRLKAQLETQSNVVSGPPPVN